MAVWRLQLGSVPLLTCLPKLLSSAHHSVHPYGPFVQPFIYLDTALIFCLILGLDSAALCQAETPQQQQPQQCLSKDLQLVGYLTLQTVWFHLLTQACLLSPLLPCWNLRYIQRLQGGRYADRDIFTMLCVMCDLRISSNQYQNNDDGNHNKKTCVCLSLSRKRELTKSSQRKQ